MTLRITYVQKSTRPGAVLASFGVHLSKQDLYLSGMRLMRKKDGGTFVSPPSFKVTKEDGTVEYKDHYFFGKETRDLFQKAILDLLKKEHPDAFTPQQAPQQEDPFFPSLQEKMAGDRQAVSAYQAASDGDLPF